MKRVLKVFLVCIFVFILSGCGKKIEKISYAQFNEYFSNEEYDIIDNTKQYGLEVRRYLEAGNGKIQVFYIEFDNEKNADKYMNGIYASEKGSKTKVKKDYTYIKNTKIGYMKLYKVDNVLLIGSADEKKYKRQVNKVLRDLGY